MTATVFFFKAFLVGLIIWIALIFAEKLFNLRLFFIRMRLDGYNPEALSDKIGLWLLALAGLAVVALVGICGPIAAILFIINFAINV